MTDWIAESTTIYWIDYAGLLLCVWQVRPGRPQGARNWRWSAWRGQFELDLSRLGYDTREKAQDAAQAYADERRYCG